MKKFAILMALITVLSVLCLPVVAVESAKNIGELPQTKEAITIDGKKDKIYDQGMTFDATLLNGTATSKVAMKAYLLWDGNKTFYAFVDVTDPTPTEWDEAQYKKSPWIVDSIELFFDFSNQGKKRDQYRVDNGGKPTYYDTATKYDDLGKYGFDAWGYQKTANGYAVEFKVSSYETALKAGGHVGIDWQINDLQKKGDSSRVVYNYNSSKQSKGALASLDFITLGSKVVSNPVETTAATTKAAATTAKTATTAAKTADMSVVIAAVATVALAGVVVCKKKH